MNAEQLSKLTKAINCLEILNKRPRPMCRDCADECGTCPHDGLECDLRSLITDARAILAERVTQPAQPVIDLGAQSEQAHGWHKVWETLSEVMPGFHNLSGIGTQSAVMAIRKLAASAQEPVAAVRAALEADASPSYKYHDDGKVTLTNADKMPSYTQAPDHETIVRQSGELICTVCGTTAPAPQPSGNSCDSDWFWNLVIAYTKGVGSEGKALVSQVDAWKDAACAVAREEGYAKKVSNTECGALAMLEIETKRATDAEAKLAAAREGVGKMRTFIVGSGYQGTDIETVYKYEVLNLLQRTATPSQGDTGTKEDTSDLPG